MSRAITRKATAALVALTAIIVSVSSCKAELTDTGAFALHYPGITDIGPSTNMDITPTWHGGTPESFEIFRIKREGEAVTAECFSVDPTSGVFSIRKSDNLPVGKYRIGIACKVGGVRHEFAEAITVNMMPAIPEGIKVSPDKITILLSQVTNTGSDEELPTAQITTDGEHISIRNYLISGVRRDGKALENWDGLFSVDKNGKFSILKNNKFNAGVYVIDFKLTTMVFGADSEEGLFSDALTVEVASAPISLVYNPSAAKVEAGESYTSPVPEFIGSVAGLEFSIKRAVPESDKFSIDKTSGVITLAKGHEYAIGDEIVLSVSAKNNYGERDFDQVLRIGIVEYIAPITLLAYNDTTVWEGTKVNLKPKQRDGDEVTYSFEELPDALKELTIDELDGTISVPKKNRIAQGEYSFKVKAQNPKGSLSATVKWNTTENPYAFTFVRWGNNLGLNPIQDYADQFRVSTTGPTTIPVIESDIKEGIEVLYEIKGGSKTKGESKINYVSIDPKTGKLTTDPSVLGGKIAQMRAHFVFVNIKTGVGTSGETVMKIPVFFDFNAPRTEGGYSIQYNPFAVRCNPKNGTTSVPPTILKNNIVVRGEELKNITMDFRRDFNYWNINGHEKHLNGAAAKGDNTKFLSRVWAAYCQACGFVYDSEAGSRKAVSYYENYEKNTNGKGDLNKAAAYIRGEDLALHINPEKFMDEYGYANGIFTGQVTLGLDGKDPQKANDPYRLFPLFVWFDTNFQ